MLSCFPDLLAGNQEDPRIQEVLSRACLDVLTLHIIPEAHHTILFRDIPFRLILLPSYSRMFLLKGKKTKPGQACVSVRHALGVCSPGFVPQADALEAIARHPLPKGRAVLRGCRGAVWAAAAPARGLGSHSNICGGTRCAS